MDNVIKNVLEKLPDLVKITASNPIRGEYKKVVLRRIEGDRWLVESHTQNKVYHTPVELQNVEKCLKTQVFGDFKQTDILFIDGAMTVLMNKKGTVTVKHRKQQTLMQVAHDRKKKYILCEGEDIPAFRDLGIFTKENRVSAAMQDKYRQINRFIETVDDVFADDTIKSLTILDFGCGKSYLTFLLYYYFTVKKGLKTQVIGYDLKEDVVEKCNDIAKKYGYYNLDFVRADVKEDKLYDKNIDMIVTLHACDTATDYALSYAIQKNVKYIFSVPCCQHEINGSIKGKGDFDIFFKHGLIKERFSALLTDAIRVEVLENAGYHVDCLEFVGIDASPKNLMIRAVKGKAQKRKNLKAEALLEKYNTRHTLCDLVGELDKQEVKNG